MGTALDGFTHAANNRTRVKPERFLVSLRSASRNPRALVSPWTPIVRRDSYGSEGSTVGDRQQQKRLTAHSYCKAPELMASALVPLDTSPITALYRSHAVPAIKRNGKARHVRAPFGSLPKKSQANKSIPPGGTLVHASPSMLQARSTTVVGQKLAAVDSQLRDAGSHALFHFFRVTAVGLEI